jgi:hypothetical protein
MTLYRFAIGLVLLSMSKAVVQAFVEAAGPLGMNSLRMFSEVDVKSDLVLTWLQALSTLATMISLLVMVN